MICATPSTPTRSKHAEAELLRDPTALAEDDSSQRIVAAPLGVGTFLREALPLLGLLCVAAVVRVFAWAQTAVLFNDGPVFLAIADAIDAGRFREVLAHPYHPLYSLGIHGVSSLGLPPETAAITVSIAGGLLGIVALHSLLERLFDREVCDRYHWVDNIANPDVAVDAHNGNRRQTHIAGPRHLPADANRAWWETIFLLQVPLDA